MAALVMFCHAVSATGAFVAGLLFFRFWRDSADRLFAFFGAAFWLLALSWGMLRFFGVDDEAHPEIYAIRLVAFLLLIAGIVDKNRSRQ